MSLLGRCGVKLPPVNQWNKVKTSAGMCVCACADKQTGDPLIKTSLHSTHRGQKLHRAPLSCIAAAELAPWRAGVKQIPPSDTLSASVSVCSVNSCRVMEWYTFLLWLLWLLLQSLLQILYRHVFLKLPNEWPGLVGFHAGDWPAHFFRADTTADC